MHGNIPSDNIDIPRNIRELIRKLDARSTSTPGGFFPYLINIFLLHTRAVKFFYRRAVQKLRHKIPIDKHFFFFSSRGSKLLMFYFFSCIQMFTLVTYFFPDYTARWAINRFGKKERLARKLVAGRQPKFVEGKRDILCFLHFFSSPPIFCFLSSLHQIFKSQLGMLSTIPRVKRTRGRRAFVLTMDVNT